ncbi:GrpB-like predicted nucleotidyltransferase (UPF0157 family) [Nocardioides albertanoniae]|uniref:GrpB-like predicted nucleotidyltransferase (UPF0157 family) n=1 Tax=Nocardioides albertanoniae TaxID=1175486 RepID=A0A543A9W3_9ACTN|nr:GrpB family protein [Nocardioides albertanoniae]TQL69392.1 GrpB-like predicted nucleotidyltransferase (UPF0157 family) [Nocardioides albertanoniae]
MTRGDRIVVVDHSPHWAGSFESARSLVEPILEDQLVRAVEHIGSTSVPGLPAKPIIDMLAVVTSYEAAGSTLPALRDVGWVAAPEPGDVEQRKWSWCSPSVAYRTHHLHVVEKSSEAWPTWLAFRDHLRTNAEDRETYAAIKRRLSAADDEDRTAYRAGKSPFIASVLDGIASES